MLSLFRCLQETEFKEDVSEYLGRLLFVKLRKRHFLQDDAWFCNWISVQGPGASGEEFRFPCYRWVEGNGILSLPEGTGEEASGAQEKLGVRERTGDRAWGAGTRGQGLMEEGCVAGGGTMQRHGGWGGVRC